MIGSPIIHRIIPRPVATITGIRHGGREPAAAAAPLGQRSIIQQSWSEGFRLGRHFQEGNIRPNSGTSREASHGLQGTLTSVWAAKQSRPTGRKIGRKSIWVFGIVDPVTGWSMVSPYREANTATMQQFLNAAAKKPGPRQHAGMVLDRAGWHTANQLKWLKRVTPLFLPPYSPKLTPAERQWAVVP